MPELESLPALKVLHLEDCEDDAVLVERALRRSGLTCEVRRVESRGDFVAALGEWRPDAILVDYNLPQFDGMAALKLARERAPRTPVIVVSGVLRDETAAALLRDGAYDYVLKDRLFRLGAAVRASIEAARNDAARREAEERYRVVFEESRDGILLVDAQTLRILETNPEFARQTGRDATELRGLPVWQLSAATAEDAERLHLKALMQNPLGSTWELGLRRPDCSDLPVELRARPVMLSGAQFILVASRDIGERRKTECVLRNQIRELRRFQRVTVDREVRMQELEAEIQRFQELKRA